jgi:uncharacterized protein YyaL (SSP411 family)
MTTAPNHRTHANRLAKEPSPYLQQHAYNPVDWHPWGEEAFAKARAEDKPVLLSIGYSACHWCHVMAHESFEDEQTAALMNEHYVCVKVDREERPDLDRIYQTAHQLLTQKGGGWPLTVFLTPDDKAPFFAGTYFPDEPRHGLPAFRGVLEHLHDVWREQRDEIRKQNGAFLESLAKLDAVQPHAARLDDAPLIAGRLALERDFDTKHGGFGSAPKFPHPATLEHMLRDPREGPPSRMALFTLERMAEGGIYDQVGGGFARYAVDEAWEIPHFEKMLYDNGPLLGLYAHGFARSGDERYRRVVEETFAWLERDMIAPNGAWCAALDADSEGVEGKYYLWTRDEVRTVIGADAYRAFAARYGLDAPPNHEGAWHLSVRRSIPALASLLEEPERDIETQIEMSLHRLRARRAVRVAPARDDKVITAWNALTIRGLATAGRLLHDNGLVKAAERALDALTRTAIVGGRLHSTWKDGVALQRGFLDDHAFLADAAVELLQARWRRSDLDLAIDLVEQMLARFQAQGGGFHLTPDDHEPLIQRPRHFADESLPSGNGVAARVLQRLGWLLGEPRYLEAAERTLRAGWSTLERHPHACPSLLGVLADTLSAPRLVVLRGSAHDLEPFKSVLREHPQVGELSFPIPLDAADLPPALASKTAKGPAVAYVCRGSVCGPPVVEPAHLRL